MLRRDFFFCLVFFLLSSPALGQQTYTIGYPSGGQHFAKTANISSYGAAIDTTNYPNGGQPVVVDILHVASGQTLDSIVTSTNQHGVWTVTFYAPGGGGWSQTGECKIRLFAQDAIRKEVTIVIDP